MITINHLIQQIRIVFRKFDTKIDSTGAYYKDVKQAVHAKSETLMYNRPVLFIRNIKNDILQSLDSIIGEIKQKEKYQKFY